MARTICVTQVALETSLSKSKNSIDNYDDYIDFLSTIINSKSVRKEKKQVSFDSEYFGELDITISTDAYYLVKGKFIVLIRIFADDDFTDEQWENEFPREHKLLNFLTTNIKDFVQVLNDKLSDIKHVTDENLIFKDERLYMEISPYTNLHTPTWVTFKILDNVPEEELIDNFYVEL